MYLKSLELSGFKSFGKKVHLEFNTPISAIVGPNGSGKSNIAEAFRFVLGEQSIKSLRGKKGEDLIFNGGKQLSRHNRAYVRALFDNKDRSMALDFDEVLIERAVNRDGTNEYKINNSDVRLKDISELLSTAHIGASGHHIISQGEADRMLSASSVERREILEEALGLKIYQHKKEESRKKLERTEENMKETESILRELAPHLKFLKKQYEKIEKSKVIREELISLYQVYFRTESYHIAQKKESLKNAEALIQASLSDLLTKKNELVITLDKEETPTHNETSYELLKVNNEKNEYLKKSGKIEGEISYISRAVEKIKRESEVSTLKTVPFSDVEKLKKDALSATTIEEIRILIDTLLNAYQDKEENQEELEKLKKELELLKQQKNEVEEHLAILEKKALEIQREIEAENLRIHNEKALKYERERDILHLESEIAQLQNKRSQIQTELSFLGEQEHNFKNDLEEAGMFLGREVIHFENTHQEHKEEDRAVQHERKRTLERLKIRLEEAGISNGPEVEKEYKDTEERDAFLRRELEDLNHAKLSLRDLMKELDEKIAFEFERGVQKINKEFNDFFKLMFGGGQASLEVLREKEEPEEGENTEEVQESKIGIDICVELPHKKTKGLMMLSGGERALTSIALLFAISQVNPPPFIILDETDAALDEANSRKYGDMIEKLSAHSELILITHNRETMSRAGIIYGVTMGSEGSSKILSIQFDEAVQVAK